jgi:predicted O-methyltransferase YrrM
LITKCLEKPVDLKLFNQFKTYKKQYTNSNEIIIVEDFGAGSKVFKSNTRKVKDIARVAGMTPIKAKLLLKLINYFMPYSILEIGTSLGIGTTVMKIAAPFSKITTLEGCNNTARKANDYFVQNQFDNISLKIGEFSETLPQIAQNQVFDLIYFDGNHQKKATLEYFNQCLNAIQNDTLFIFDDIHWTLDMEQAWKEICNNDKVTLSLDLYHIGLIFFKKELSKQHLALRV